MAELKHQDVHGVRWQDVVSNNVLFPKVCDEIYGHDYLFAEVTEPNANVLVEVGYALAVGRPTILLKDKSQPEWTRTLLTAFDNCLYDTRESIVPYIVETQTNRGELPETPDRRLPSLEKMGIFDPAEEVATIHHLKPKIARDWISSVEKTLKGSYFDVSETDPNDSSYDEFYPQARAIQRASLIVGSLLVLQRRFKEGCPEIHEGRLGAWYGSAWPVRYYPAYPRATAATHPARTVPGAASPAPPGTPGAS